MSCGAEKLHLGRQQVAYQPDAQRMQHTRIQRRDVAAKSVRGATEKHVKQE